MPNGYRFSIPQSQAFWGALRSASVDILSQFGLPLDVGHKRYSAWKHGRPMGVTSHFTAGPGWEGSVRWLSDGGHDNQVSCQMIILDRMLPQAVSAYAKHPELADLEVVTLLLSDGIIPCWHAGWVNRLSFGIENRNAGPLKGKPGDWRWWAKKWRALFPHEALGKTPQLIDGQYWEPYTAEQIKANILVGQHLNALYQDEGGLDPRWYLPHSATTGTKWDTGRAYPLHDVRDAVFAGMPIEGIPWLQSFEAAPVSYIAGMEKAENQMFFIELEGRQADRQDRGLCEGDLTMPTPDMQSLIQAGAWKDDLDAVRVALHRLGYVTSGQGPTLDEDTALAVYQFQRSIDGLEADKIPGYATQRALWGRLRDFRLQTT